MGLLHVWTRPFMQAFLWCCHINLPEFPTTAFARTLARMSRQIISYKRHRSPSAVITHAVWLYCRFNLSFREIEEVFLECGIS